MTVLILALAVTGSVAAAMVMQKQWTNEARVYSIDAEGSYISLDSAVADGNATVAISLHNTGTADMYIKSIIIVSGKLEVWFIGGKAWLNAPSVGRPVQGAFTASNPTKVSVSEAWLILPPMESAYVRFTMAGMNKIVALGDRYLASIYTIGSGEIETFSLTVQSA